MDFYKVVFKKSPTYEEDVKNLKDEGYLLVDTYIDTVIEIYGRWKDEDEVNA